MLRSSSSTLRRCSLVAAALAVVALAPSRAQAQFSLPERLSDLPAALVERPDVERMALAQRLDVQDARLLAYAYAFEQATKLRVTPAHIGGP